MMVAVESLRWVFWRMAQMGGSRHNLISGMLDDGDEIITVNRCPGIFLGCSISVDAICMYVASVWRRWHELMRRRYSTEYLELPWFDWQLWWLMACSIQTNGIFYTIANPVGVVYAIINDSRRFRWTPALQHIWQMQMKCWTNPQYDIILVEQWWLLI